MSDCVTATGENELHKLRGREAELESLIAEQKSGFAPDLKNLTRLGEQLSDCKKAIVELTIVKLAANAS